MCTPRLFAPPQQMAEPIPSLPQFFLPPEISSFWRTSIAITPSGTQEARPTPEGKKYSTGSSLLTSSPSMTLTHPLFSIAPLAVAPPDISFAPSTLAFSCSWEGLQDLGSDHLPILLSVSLSPVFCPNERPPSFNFQKGRWDGFASYIDSHCPSAEEYSSLSLSSVAAIFTCLALNAAKSSIPFGRIKRPPKAWWSAEVEEAVSERRKAFAAAHRSDEDLQAYISASRRASSVIAKAKAEAWQTTCSILSPKSNPKSVHFFALLLALLPCLPPLLTFLTVLLPGKRLRFMPLTSDPTFSFLSQRPCVAEPEATSLSSAKPRDRRSLTRPFALLSLPLNFLQLPQTFCHPPPLAQTKLPIPC